MWTVVLLDPGQGEGQLKNNTIIGSGFSGPCAYGNTIGHLGPAHDGHSVDGNRNNNL